MPTRGRVMLGDFFLGDWQGTVVALAGGLFALAALVYIPAPLKHYAVSFCLIAACVLKVYSLGHTQAAAECDATINAMTAKINDENEKAISAAIAGAKADAAANMAAVKRVLDAQTAAAEGAEASYQQALDAIARAGADADGVPPSLILEAIRQKRIKK